MVILHRVTQDFHCAQVAEMPSGKQIAGMQGSTVAGRCRRCAFSTTPAAPPFDCRRHGEDAVVGDDIQLPAIGAGDRMAACEGAEGGQD
jgi:hypothetical protein